MTKPMYIWDGLSWQPAVDNLLGTTAKVVYQASEPNIVEVGTVWVNSSASAVPDYTATSATQIAYSPSLYVSASATNVQLAIDYNRLHPFISVASSAHPISPNEGLVIYETDTKKTYMWNGLKWASVSDSSALYESTDPSVSDPFINSGTFWIDSDNGALKYFNGTSFVEPEFFDYLTLANASTVYLNKASASSIYLTQSSASSTYTTPAQIAQDYLSKSSASSTYLAQSSASSTYLTQFVASTDYLTIADAIDDYLPKTASMAFTRWRKTYSASATAITGSDDNLYSLQYNPGYEQVFINGVLLANNEYTTTNSNLITLNQPVLPNEIIDIHAFQNSTNVSTYTQGQIDSKYNEYSRWKKAYATSASVITGMDDNGTTLNYTAGYEQVYLNGILLTPITDYTRLANTVITFSTPIVSGDILEIIGLKPFNVASLDFEPNIPYVSASPTSPVPGTLWIDSTTITSPKLKVYNGTKWIAVSGGGGDSGLHPFFGVR
jgi:hypothetical protein